MAEGSAVPTASKGSWGSFLKFSAYWAEMPSVLVAPASEQDKQRRCMLVLKWFLSTLKQQYTSRNEKLVTAYSIWNKQHGVRLQGYNAQKASFGRTINVKQIGHAVLHIDEYDEDYLITLPALHIEGLITGSPYVELEKNTHIVSSTGYTCKIDYSGKGWVSGKKNSFTATMYPNGREKDVIYNAEGQWSGSFVIKDAHKKVQDPLESRRAWYKVAEAINRGDMDTTSAEKSLIENQQRELRKTEKEQGSEWQRRFFNRVSNSPRFDAMIHQVPGGSLEADKTNGVWEFDPARAMAANPAYQI
ncbi:unnamed protein product [Aureobasidium vineae]|uniref:Oxysterol-binding protein n=1 Tax=Aureobasidium vineae TaxID=2773715 RepID=A0A9N8JDK3_9PEZI|nr:unnamed protein product [Aureobasidium vineae]